MGIIGKCFIWILASFRGNEILLIKKNVKTNLCMETYIIEKDLYCHCIKATSFPEGVLAAHQLLQSLFAFDGKRKFYGISRPEGTGEIAYWAAVEKTDDDNLQDNRPETFVILKGQYSGIDIKNFRSDIQAIGRTFQQLLVHPELDPNGYCLEWYYNMNDVRCMVRLKDATE
jgi:hypothetical protein